jgi:hypothetical protein
MSSLTDFSSWFFPQTPSAYRSGSNIFFYFLKCCSSKNTEKEQLFFYRAHVILTDILSS